MLPCKMAQICGALRYGLSNTLSAIAIVAARCGRSLWRRRQSCDCFQQQLPVAQRLDANVCLLSTKRRLHILFSDVKSISYLMSFSHMISFNHVPSPASGPSVASVTLDHQAEGYLLGHPPFSGSLKLTGTSCRLLRLALLQCVMIWFRDTEWRTSMSSP